MVPEWRAKYLDYKVRLRSVPLALESSLTAPIGWQEEGQGDYSCPSSSSSEPSYPIISSTSYFLSRRETSVPDALQHRQAAPCGRASRYDAPTAGWRQFLIEYSFRTSPKDRATAASNTRIAIFGNSWELWQHPCDTDTATRSRVGCCFVRASRPRTGSG